MDGIYYVIKDKQTGKSVSPRGVSLAPHLYRSKGKAEGQRQSRYFYRPDNYEVVAVQLTEIKEPS